jgi:hypothetical protein
MDDQQLQPLAMAIMERQAIQCEPEADNAWIPRDRRLLDGGLADEGLAI